METRSTYSCRHCGRNYEGRGIFADHPLAQVNLDRHEAVCVEQQERRAAAEAKRQLRVAQRYRRRLERLSVKHGNTPPMAGQLGFPFEGVPEMVA